AGVDPTQPISSVRTMDDLIDLDVADRQQQMTLLTAFAALALVLAAVGLYGVLSYAVTQRSRELGLRIALGASTGSVMRMVVGRGPRDRSRPGSRRRARAERVPLRRHRRRSRDVRRSGECAGHDRARGVLSAGAPRRSRGSDGRVA